MSDHDHDHDHDDESAGEGRQLTRIEDVRTFLLAGNARFTLVSKRTATRFSYRIRASEDKRVFFVGVLTGTNNEAHYAYLGTIRPAHLEYTWGHKSKIAASAPSSNGFAWFWDHVRAGRLPATVEVWHEGRCGRCGRTLTVPQSIERGIGPDCAQQMAA